MITTCRREGCGNTTHTPFASPVYCSSGCESIDLIGATIGDLDPDDADTATVVAVSAELQAALKAAEDPATTVVIEAGWLAPALERWFG